MIALLLFAGHLKGVCENQYFIKHYVTMCRSVFSNCDNVLVTYRNLFGTVRNTKSYDFTKKTQSIDKCLHILQEKVDFKKITIVNETLDKTTYGRVYPKHYVQMINTIRKGLMSTYNMKDIVIRMRPDSGLPRINAIWSLKTWQTLLTIPEHTIVQYGTWKVRGKNEYYNGDNCFAARWSTFVNFTLFWQNEFYKDYRNQIELSNNTVHQFELTMNSVSKRHGYELLPDPKKLISL